MYVTPSWILLKIQLFFVPNIYIQIAFACLLTVAFSSTVKSDDSEAAKLYYPYYYPSMNGVAINGLGVNGLGVNGLGINGLGINGLGYSHRRWARSAGTEETDVAQKDTEVAETYYPYYYPAMNGVTVNGLGFNGLGINGLGINGLGINGLGHSLRWARSVRAEETDATQKDTDVAEQYYPFFYYPAMNGAISGRSIYPCSSQGSNRNRRFVVPGC